MHLVSQLDILVIGDGRPLKRESVQAISFGHLLKKGIRPDSRQF